MSVEILATARNRLQAGQSDRRGNFITTFPYRLDQYQKEGTFLEHSYLERREKVGCNQATKTRKPRAVEEGRF